MYLYLMDCRFSLKIIFATFLLNRFPKTEALRPKIGALRPKTGALRPKMGALRPKTGALRPKMGALRLKFCFSDDEDLYS
jgi:hypothetical protein